MRRLHFLSPNTDSAESIVDELHKLGLSDRNIHIVGKDSHELKAHHLNEAGLLQTTDVVPAMERGAVVGCASGLLAGVVAVSFPPAGLVLGGGAVLGLSLIGAGFGAWVSSMIGISIPNEVVEEYEKQIHKGQLLMMIDLEDSEDEKIAKLIKKHHPEAKIEGIDLNMPKTN